LPRVAKVHKLKNLNNREYPYWGVHTLKGKALPKKREIEWGERSEKGGGRGEKKMRVGAEKDLSGRTKELHRHLLINSGPFCWKMGGGDSKKEDSEETRSFKENLKAQAQNPLHGVRSGEGS